VRKLRGEAITEIFKYIENNGDIQGIIEVVTDKINCWSYKYDDLILFHNALKIGSDVLPYTTKYWVKFTEDESVIICSEYHLPKIMTRITQSEITQSEVSNKGIIITEKTIKIHDLKQVSKIFKMNVYRYK
jgi:hypothetical protein